MRSNWRDTAVTVLVVAVVVPYVGYVMRGSMPFIDDARGMSATGLALGVLAAAVIGRAAFGGRGSLGRDTATFGLLSLVAGLAALVWADISLVSEVLLAAFIVTMIATWALAVANDMRHRHRGIAGHR